MSAEEFSLTIADWEPEEPTPEEILAQHIERTKALADYHALREPDYDREEVEYYDALLDRQEIFLSQFHEARAELAADPAFREIITAQGERYNGIVVDDLTLEHKIHPEGPEVWLQVQAARHAFAALDFSANPNGEDLDLTARGAAQDLLKALTPDPWDGQAMAALFNAPVDFSDPIVQEYSADQSRVENLLTERLIALSLGEGPPPGYDNTAELLVCLSRYNEPECRDELKTILYLEDWMRADRAKEAKEASAAAAG